MQNHYNLLYREEEREMTSLCRDQGVGMIPWSPLARGRLARSAASSEPTSRSQSDRFGKSLYGASAEADLRVIERVDAVAKARGVPNAQVALAWLLGREGTTAPIVGATKMQHLEDAVAALSVKLSDEEVRLLEEPYVPHAVAGFE
jgi:aryl-alcohol dehydrogenase-like predicted oxidoreductase